MTEPQTPMPDTSPPEAPAEAPSEEEGDKYDGGAIPGGADPEVPEAS